MIEQVKYQDSFGEIEYPEGFEVLIQGLPIEEQVQYFRLGNGLYLSQAVLERRKSECNYSCRLDADEDVKSLIIKDGKIAGIMVSNVHGEIKPCLVEQGYCIRSDSELDGSGYKSFVLYQYLICVPKEFD